MRFYVKILLSTNHLLDQLNTGTHWVLKFQNGWNKVIIALRVVQFWSEIMLVMSNRTLATHSSDFKITCMISDQIYSTYPFSLIAGFHCHAIKNKNKTINSRIWEMKWGWYRKTLAKIQVSVIFHTRNILRNSSPKLIERFLWRRHVGAHPDGHQHGLRKLTETSVTEFCWIQLSRNS